MDERYTEEGLPVITRGAVERYKVEHHVEGTIRENLPSQPLGELLFRENPELFRYVNDLKKFHEERGEKEIAEAITIGVGIAYNLLRSQAEANQLEDSERK